MEFNQIIGYNFKKHRKKSSMTTKAMASCLDISSKDILLYEAGKKNMPKKTLRRAAILFGIPEADFYKPNSKIKEIIGKLPELEFHK